MKIGWVHQVYNTNVPKGADDLITTPDNYYPDPIIDDETENIELGKSKTLWVDVYVPRTTEAGIYKCQLTVQGETESGISRIRKNFFVKVCPVTLPEEQQLKVVNWYSRSDVKYLDEKKNVEIGSERYLQLLQLIAETGASYGQNCWLIQEKPDLKLNADSTVEGAVGVALGAEGPKQHALTVVAEQTSADAVQADKNIGVQHGHIRKLAGAVRRTFGHPPKVSDRGITVILDQDVASQAVQTADGLGVIPLEVVFIEGGGGHIDEAFLADANVVELGRNERAGKNPLANDPAAAVPNEKGANAENVAFEIRHQ